MNYLFMPLEQQTDSGFGVMGDAFRAAAEQLDNDKEYGTLFHRRLPVCYLYRHAIELYLKSAITILHRGARMPGKDGKFDLIPRLCFHDKDGKTQTKPIHAEHSVSNLRLNLTAYESVCREGLANITTVKFEITPEIHDLIRVIEEYDGKSTYFRYPMTTESKADDAKSAMQSIEYEKLRERQEKEPSKVCAFVVVDDDGNVVESFHHDESGIEAAYAALKKVCDYFADYHAALRAEVSKGW